MSEGQPDRSTDIAWEQWGRRDPYFGVITLPQFRRDQMTEEARREFFRSGEVHVQFVLDYVRHFIDANFKPDAVLDFGCGVGRTLLPFAATAGRATGLDVSPSMLQEARRNCDAQGRQNVQLLLSDDQLSAVTGDFDLIHSCIVFQHIPIARGRAIFAQLLRFLRPGGIAVLCEPWGENPLLRWARGVLPYPGKGRTAAEQPLRRRHLAILRDVFPEVQATGYQLLSMARRVLPASSFTRLLENCDARLLTRVPALGQLCRYMVLTLRR